MIASVISCALSGLSGRKVSVEVDLSGGLPSYATVGLPDKAVTESQERVRTALRNAGYPLPPARIVVNLAPAGLKKIGTVYDLPIALGLLCAMGELPQDVLQNRMFVGELALGGAIRPVSGALSMAAAAKDLGLEAIFVPAENADESACVRGIDTVAVHDLKELVSVLKSAALPNAWAPPHWEPLSPLEGTDFSLIRGQYAAKRAAEIAAAGAHNMLLCGPPGSGKTMLARAMPTILPDLTFEEALEITRVRSCAGYYEQGLCRRRPFVAPHHSASKAAIVGGGTFPRPGEASLAHLGVLFLDEMPEFSRDVLETLRQPLEDGMIRVSRARGAAEYPCRFMLIGAMNLCPCGNLGVLGRECTCSKAAILSYRRKISGPLLDRMDMFIQMNAVCYDDLHGTSRKAERSEQIRARVNCCRALQQERLQGSGVTANAYLGPELIERYCVLSDDAKQLFQCEFDRRGMSGRSNAHTLRLARTIADLDQSDLIRAEHLAEALQYQPPASFYSG